MLRKLLGLLAVSFMTLAMIAGARPAAAQAGYALQPGDVLQVEVLEDPSLNRSVIVLPDGSISFPQAGTLRAGGRTVDQVRGALVSALSPNFAVPPTVYVSVGSLAPPPAGPAKRATIDVYVLGEVGSPGRREVLKNTNLLQFLAEAGSLSRFAAKNRIELHRLDPATKTAHVYLFDLDNVAGNAAHISGMTSLVPGDVVVIPQRRLFE